MVSVGVVLIILVRPLEILKNRLKGHSTGRDKNSDCVKHLNDNFNHEFQWFVLSHGSKMSIKYFVYTKNFYILDYFNLTM